MKRWKRRFNGFIAVLLSVALILPESGTVFVHAAEINQEVMDHTEELPEDRQPDSEASEGINEEKTDAEPVGTEEKSGLEVVDNESEESEDGQEEAEKTESGKDLEKPEEANTGEEPEKPEEVSPEEKSEKSEDAGTEESQVGTVDEEVENGQDISGDAGADGLQDEAGDAEEKEGSRFPEVSETDVTVMNIEDTEPDEDGVDADGVDYILGRPMTEEEEEEQRQLIKEYTSHLSFFEPDEKTDRVLSDNQDLVRDAQLPSIYSSVDQGYVTSIKNQNPFGTCWAFSSANLAETSLIKKGLMSKNSADLSEYHMAYYSYRSVTDPLGGTEGDRIYRESLDDILNRGGNYSATANAMLAWRGAVSETTVPYPSSLSAASELPDRVYDAYGRNIAVLRNTREINKEDVSLIKQTIMEWGAVGISYYSPSETEYYNVNTGAQYCDQYFGTNHAVSIVGWDDNYSKSNFTIQPSKDGAWLVKNSWGTWYANQGYFWLSYEDATIWNTVYAFDMMKTGTYDNNYQYDGALGYGSLGSSGKITVANVFTAHAREGKKEILKAVSFSVGSVNTDYSIQIYKNPMDAENPESGTAVLSVPQTGQGMYAGTYTVDLKSPIELEYGDIFAVVVTLIKNDGKASIRMEWDSKESVASALPGCSLLKNGNSWIEYGNLYGKNFRIKAYTANTDLASAGVRVTGIRYLEKELTSTIKPGETKQLTSSVIPGNAANKKITWSSSDTSVAAVDENGKVTGKKTGKTIVTAITVDGNYSVKYQVEVKLYDSISISGSNTISNIGETSRYQAIIKPEDAPNKAVTWSTSNAGVVSIDSNGVATANGIGTAVITATLNADKNFKALIKITVPDNTQNRVRGFVERMYTVALNRKSDATGAAYWTNELLQGNKDGAAVAKGFILSKEMENRRLNDDQYVMMLYKTFFNREPSANDSGKAFWLNLLKNGVTRTYVFRGFCHSQEFTNICANYGITRGQIKLTDNRDQNHNITMYVYRCYNRTLGRTPDDRGMSYWTGQLLQKKKSASDVAGNFVFSQEFKNKKLSDEEFVKVMYRMFFDREADANGQRFWVNELKTGRRDRYKVFTGFVNSQEFKNVLKTFGL